MAVTLSNEEVAASPMGAGGAPRVSQIEPTGRGLAEKTAGVAAGLVKGAGQVRGTRGATGYNLDESVHGGEIFTKAHDTITLGKAAALGGWNDGDGVADTLQPGLHVQPGLHRPDGRPVADRRTTRWSARRSPRPTRGSPESRTAWCRLTCLPRAADLPGLHPVPQQVPPPGGPGRFAAGLRPAGYLRLPDRRPERPRHLHPRARPDLQQLDLRLGQLAHQPPSDWQAD